MAAIAKMLSPVVWVMAPDIDSSGDPRFDWEWSAWAVEPRLIVQSQTHAQRGTGSASFRVVRSRQISGAGENNNASLLRAGVYVLITSAEQTTGEGEAAVRQPVIDASSWLGILTDLDEAPLDARTAGAENAQIPDGFGTATASELGESLLDKVRAIGWAQYDGTNYGTAVPTIPTANMAGPGGRIIGNARLGQYDGGTPVYHFARTLADCGTSAEKLWTPWRLVTHAATYCCPRGAPPIVIRCEDDSGLSGDAYAFTGLTGLAAYLDSTDAPEVVELDGLTWSGVLDLVCGTGVAWRQEVRLIGGAYKVAVVLYSRSTTDSRWGAPKRGTGNAVNISTQRAETAQTVADITVSGDGSEQYDAVTVQGAPIVFGVSLSYLDGNLEAGWSAEQQTAYDAATSEERRHPAHAAAYALFRIKRDTATTGVIIATNPGTDDAPRPMTPEVSWDGSTATITTTNRDQYLPALRILSALPWPSGWSEDGTTTADATGSNTERQSPIGVYHYDADGTPVWCDLLSRTTTPTFTPLGESPEVSVDENGPALRVAYTEQHTLGLETYAGSAGSSPAYDWRNLVLTVAVPSTQRLEVTNYRYHNGAEMTASQVRRSLVLRDDSLQYIAALAGTVLGTKEGNAEPLRVTADTVIRNDFKAAQRWCSEVSAWAFRPRNSVSARFAIGQGHGLKVGVLIRQVQIGNTTRQIDGITAAVSVDWSSGFATLQTELPPMPQRRGGSSPQGGPISVELGATAAQVIQRHEAKIDATAARVAALPVIPRMGGGAVAPHRMLSLIGGNLLTGGVQGLKYAADPLTLTDAWDPNTDPVMDDGIGRAVLYVDGQPQADYVLIRHNFPAWPAPLVTGQRVAVLGTVSLVYDAGGPDEATLTAYTFAPWLP